MYAAIIIYRYSYARLCIVIATVDQFNGLHYSLSHVGGEELHTPSLHVVKLSPFKM